MTYTSYYEYATNEDLDALKDDLYKKVADTDKKLHDITKVNAKLTKSVYQTNQIVNNYLGGTVTDDPYGVGWDGATNIAPSANAVYDALSSTNSTVSSLSATVNNHTTSISQHDTDIATLYNNVANKANISSPTFTGTPSAPTATAGTSTTQIATTEFVTNALSTKADIASPTFTGTPSAPTATEGANTTQIATTAFVTTAVSTGLGTINQYSDEKAQDGVGGILTNTTSINLTYNDATPSMSASANFGSSAGTVCQGNDSRLSDARTPLSHASSHASGGSDAIKLDDLEAPDDNTDLNSSTTRHGLCPKLPGGTTTFLRGDGTWATPSGSSGAPSIWDIHKRPTYMNEFIGTSGTATSPFTGAAISSGTTALLSTSETRHHPGVVRLSSSTTSNSGYRYYMDTSGFRLGGNEAFSCVFQLTTTTNTTTRIGYFDTSTSSDATDGAYLEIVGTTASAKTSNNSSRTTNGTTYTVTTGVWYGLYITVNSDATSVNFTLRLDDGTVLLNVNNTTNIPTASGRETGCGVISTNSGTSSVQLIVLDYMSFGWVGDLTR